MASLKRSLSEVGNGSCAQTSPAMATPVSPPLKRRKKHCALQRERVRSLKRNMDSLTISTEASKRRRSSSDDIRFIECCPLADVRCLGKDRRLRQPPAPLPPSIGLLFLMSHIIMCAWY